MDNNAVAPHAGAWIETLVNWRITVPIAVAPHAGAWIETIDTNNKPLEKLAERGLVAAKAMRAKKVFYGSYRFDQHTKPPIVDGLNKYIELVTKLTAGELQALGEFVKGHDFRVNPFGVEEAA